MAMAGPALKIRLMTLSEKLGPYPHKALNFPPPRPSNATRSKAKCPECGYEVSLLKRWADFGAPICPKDKVRMEEYSNQTIEGHEPEEEKETIKEFIHRAVS